MDLVTTGFCIGFIYSQCFETKKPEPPPQGALFCQVAEPFLWSPNDTRKSKEQADTHNRKGKKLCGWK